ncbi:hypothetical protein D1631_05580 [Chryseobacterium nematophagum]|uniref:Uncharacterized protein n=1 Tax=Chryseobacterium nematophagum TaxID=2305228 RepID=A0A3M7TGU6_9FLAO|nr:hypothetical protein [Chryseobacterium nematophagum]RNA61440.1 hypothetical protein D1631_05580 [Chryseobacterium nematophagum]
MKNFIIKLTIISSLIMLVSCTNDHEELPKVADKKDLSVSAIQRQACPSWLTDRGAETLRWSSDRRFILARNLLRGNANLGDYVRGVAICHEVSAYIKFLYDGGISVNAF